MQKTILILCFALAMALSTATIANAASAPIGGCPTNFELMEVMPHDAMEHMHVGVTVDLNGDGYLCMRKATSAIHVHMDNVLPLH